MSTVTSEAPAAGRATPTRHRPAPTLRTRLGRLGPHAVLLFYTLVACGPIVLIIMNSFKSRRAIFDSPFTPPTAETFDAVGYSTVFERARFELYFGNSLVVTLAAVFLVLLLGAMAAFALAEYEFKGNALLGLYLAVGIMIPIRLGSVSILRMLVSLNLIDTRTALVLVYTAMGLPLAVFILTLFFRQVPKELKEAARVDGASEYWVFRMVVPLVRPGLAAVAVFTMLPIWNDLWFPLILTPGESVRTVTLGAQLFLGQFVSDWNAVLAVLTLAMVPMMALYVIFSKQFMRGLTSGAIK
ncbi:carbohydrate ABC transporter permease [Nitriliruptor alkaliphilus]|uniref:carbohydrate ABC transporter permease n=1 Tax=Nitriliruptor alkaliphilus TaxID=427918 RepID=UPI0009F9E1AE|nr:carbohydrate ABC transporter permease [Nitriliruptor alkaliphilus]